MAEPVPGLTREQAIEVMDRVLDAAEAALAVRRAPGVQVTLARNVARTLMRALCEAGAFTDGKNWGDRIPVQPGEGITT